LGGGEILNGKMKGRFIKSAFLKAKREAKFVGERGEDKGGGGELLKRKGIFKGTSARGCNEKYVSGEEKRGHFAKQCWKHWQHHQKGGETRKGRRNQTRKILRRVQRQGRGPRGGEEKLIDEETKRKKKKRGTGNSAKEDSKVRMFRKLRRWELKKRPIRRRGGS